MSTKRKKVYPDHYIVAIGASAGGLESINLFFDAVKEFKNLSFIIIQHLSSDYKSLLVELVAKHTVMQVYEAKDSLTAEKECVYVIPNKMMMTIRNGMLKLVEKTTDNVPNNAIDIFFQSLAQDKGDRAIAVILSGTGSDGTRGIDFIKREKGHVVVQDPATAKFDGMPKMAIMSGNADAILDPKKMAEHINQYINGQTNNRLNHQLSSPTDEQFERIIQAVFSQGGNDFNYYKTPTMLRRIHRRMKQQNILEIEPYITKLNGDKKEAQELGKDFLINVTRFFRDPESFTAIREKLLPEIIRNKSKNDSIKIWICACSTGEEAYSLAILFDEYLQQIKSDLHVKYFATDIEESNIRFASKNHYPLSIATDVPDNLLSRYFVRDGSVYSVIPRIRKQIVFARHNVIKDPAFIKNDLVSCRNMLIYMNKLLQEKILATFHYSLNPGGYLFLGSSETVPENGGFDKYDHKWKIFKRLDNYVPRDSMRLPSQHVLSNSVPKIHIERQNTMAEAIIKEFQKVMFDELGYILLYVDNYYEIKESLGNFNRLLSLPKKRLNLNLLSMVPEELNLPLGNAIRKSRLENQTVELKRIRFKNQSNTSWVNIRVQPASYPYESLSMVILSEVDSSQDYVPDQYVSTESFSGDQQRYIDNIEKQLDEARKSLQLAVEGLETTNEELQSSNEELLSSNEELQSSNEELQSLNEELHTLNVEHQNKIKELIDLNDDLDNYLSSTEIGQVFLDSDLNIRKFNQPAMRLINLIESDIGRPIVHISNNLQQDELLEDIKKVKQTSEIIEKEVKLHNGAINLQRIYPFLRRDKEIDGVVLTFVDISDVKNLHGILKGVFDSSLNAIFILSILDHDAEQPLDFNIVTQNYAAEKLLETLNTTLGKDSTFFNIFGSHLGKEATNKLFQGYHHAKHTHLEIQLRVRDTSRWYELSTVRLKDGLVLTFTDMTGQKDALNKLRKNYNELIVTRESLRELNSNLETEVENRTQQLSQSEERFRLVAKATNDCIRDWDLVNNKVWYSENFYKLFDYSIDKRLNQIDCWFQKIHDDDINQLKKGIFGAINSGLDQWSSEYRFKKGDGTYSYVLERSFILNDTSSVPYRIISSLMDVTKLKEAELATKELVNKKDEFMSIASHELKTPITSMKASLQLIGRITSKDGGNKRLTGYISKANQQVDKLTFLVESLLDVSKIQAGKIQLHKSHFLMSDIIEDAIYEVHSMGKHRVVVLGDQHVEVFADKHRIEQVIINFLTNAIKYSPDAERVDLQIDHDGTYVAVHIKDYGIGIPKEKLELIFDRFFRVEEASSQFSGLGLGLFIAADIIKRHGGNVNVESQQGIGSSFSFTLPINH